MTSNRTRLAAAIAVTAVVAGGAGAAGVALTDGNGSRTVTVTSNSAAAAANVAQSDLSVQQIAQRYTRSVVEIIAAGTSTSFPSGNRSEQAEGSGFVYDSAGHIVTNQHVIDGASSVKVTFADGSSFKATVVGSDAATDLALLKVDAPASKLFPVQLADSSSVQVGEGVVAIGDPFGLDGTVTSGIVSGVDRQIDAPDGTPIAGAIQTDAAINHGNSGGALFDLEGRVIGVTSQIESNSGGNEGVGFAVPSSTVKSVVGQLLASGKVEHAFLGVEPATAPGEGVRVASVQPGTAAAGAGLRAGDVIKSVNGKGTPTAASLRALIDSHKPGDKLTLAIRRNGTTRTISVTLGSRSS